MLKVRQDETSERKVGGLLQRRMKLLGGHATALKINGTTERLVATWCNWFVDKKIGRAKPERVFRNELRARLRSDLVLRLSRAAIVLQLSTVTRCHVSGTYARSVHTTTLCIMYVFWIFTSCLTTRSASINYTFFSSRVAYKSQIVIWRWVAVGPRFFIISSSEHEIMQIIAAIAKLSSQNLFRSIPHLCKIKLPC